MISEFNLLFSEDHNIKNKLLAGDIVVIHNDELPSLTINIPGEFSFHFRILSFRLFSYNKSGGFFLIRND
jgi:hypothetical protein